MFKLYGSSGRSQFNTKDLLANFSCRDPLSELCLLVLTESKDRDWEVSLEINFFRPFGPQLGLKIREGARLPWIRHTKMVLPGADSIFFNTTHQSFFKIV